MDKALKQRLVGASVLIALAIIVLPMLLSGRQDGARHEPKKIELPPQPQELSFDTRRYPVGEHAQQGPGDDEANIDQEPANQPPLPDKNLQQEHQQNRQQTSEQPSDEAPEPEEVTHRPVHGDGQANTALSPTSGAEGGSSAEPEGQLPVEADRPHGASSTPGRYIVQVASFGSAENANRLAGDLQQQGFSVLMDSVTSDVGTLNRVRVGPFDSDADAAAAITRLKAQNEGVNPRLMDLQPDESVRVTQPEDPLVRWVVQVGSFSNAANAENLVARLREAGMSAYSETVASGSATIHRVRVGPFLQREDALSTNQQVQESMALDGVVMSVN
jgi:DedD protein